MKKMMMILAALSAVTLAHAAAIKWQSGKFNQPNADNTFSTKKVKAGNVWGYLFLITEDVYNSLGNPEAVHAMFDTGAKTFNGAVADASVTCSGNGNIFLETGNTPETDHLPGEYYAAIVYEYFGQAVGGDAPQPPLTGPGAASATHWIANAAHVSIGGGADNSTSNLGLIWHGDEGNETTDKFSGWNAVTSTSEPVPEPMCAALFALGAAALGLRRRR